ncbi:MAG: DEAD/DEAH box helicase [Bacteroidota bacterium]
MKFNELNLSDEILEAISYMGFEEATPIQEQAVPAILDGKDMIACAQTGTGKTAAFILPVLNRIKDKEIDGVNTLVIVPTRELAMQIDQAIQGFSYFVGATSICLYGGTDGSEWEQQKKALKEGAHIVVATPGKLISHLDMGYVNFKNLEHLILDEADRMLDMGFYEDIVKIINHMPKERQTLMFSATMPPNIRKLASKILNDQVEINIAMSKPAEGVLQAAYLCYDNQKNKLIESLLADKPEYSSILIFCSTKKKVAELERALRTDKYQVKSISSDLEQKQREEVLLGFRSRRIRILVATDVMSRGIDIKDIDLVINYDVPQDAEDYVHRVGRTARAKGTGVALTLVNQDDMKKLADIERLIESEILKLPVPPEIGDSPEWQVKSYQKEGKKKKFYRKGKKK